MISIYKYICAIIYIYICDIQYQSCGGYRAEFQMQQSES